MAEVVSGVAGEGGGVRGGGTGTGTQPGAAWLAGRGRGPPELGRDSGGSFHAALISMCSALGHPKN